MMKSASGKTTSPGETLFLPLLSARVFSTAVMPMSGEEPSGIGDAARDGGGRDGGRAPEIDVGVFRAEATGGVGGRGTDRHFTAVQEAHASARARSAARRQHERAGLLEDVEQSFPMEPARRVFRSGRYQKAHVRSDAASLEDAGRDL